MITLKNDFANFSRKVDSKIALLREVIERVQKGEDVDVEGLLGGGDPEKELEWEAVIDEIQQEEKLWQPRKKKADQLPPMDDASKDASKDASTQTHKSQTSPQAGSETTARADASGSGGARVAGGRTSVGAPRTFY